MRPLNFGPGPATLPESVLQQAADEMLDWHGLGLSVMEMSHRSQAFGEILEALEEDLRALLEVPASYHVLFMQGGASAQNALVPLNLLGDQRLANFVHTGIWSGKSIAEAGRYAKAHVIASSASSGFDHIPPPSTWQIDAAAAYVQICANETIGGVQYHFTPQTPPGVPLVADISSEILSRPIDVARYGLLYAGAQKNLGIAGLTVVVIDRALLGRARPQCPSVMNYSLLADAHSMLNTPPTYAIYMAGLMTQWVRQQAHGAYSALEVMQQRNRAKADLLYAAIDASTLYRNRIAGPDRSLMNVPFTLTEERLQQPFLDAAQAAGLRQLKGHSSVGGMRASLYNAMPYTGVQRLVAFMQDFEQRCA